MSQTHGSLSPSLKEEAGLTNTSKEGGGRSCCSLTSAAWRKSRRVLSIPWGQGLRGEVVRMLSGPGNDLEPHSRVRPQGVTSISPPLSHSLSHSNNRHSLSRSEPWVPGIGWGQERLSLPSWSLAADLACPATRITQVDCLGNGAASYTIQVKRLAGKNSQLIRWMKKTNPQYQPLVDLSGTTAREHLMSTYTVSMLFWWCHRGRVIGLRPGCKVSFAWRPKWQLHLQRWGNTVMWPQWVPSSPPHFPSLHNGNANSVFAWGDPKRWRRQWLWSW